FRRRTDDVRHRPSCLHIGPRTRRCRVDICCELRVRKPIQPRRAVCDLQRNRHRLLWIEETGMTYKNAVVRRLHDQQSLGFGGAPIGNLYRDIDDETAIAAVTEAWDLGIRYFDTAPHYGLGLSERRLGEALSAQPREQFLLSTKVGRLIRPAPRPTDLDDEGFMVPGDRVRVRDYSGDGVRRSIDESLERLGTDHIDIVYIHDPDDYWAEAIDGAAPMLSQLRDEGVIGAWGAGMNQSEMLARFVRETDIDLVMQAGRYTLLEQGGREELVPECERRG